MTVCQVLLQYFEAKWGKDVLEQRQAELLGDGDILEYKGKLYYRYTPLTTEQMIEFLDQSKDRPPNAFDRLRPLIHPLYTRSVNLAQAAILVPDEQKRGARIIGLKATMDEATLCKEVFGELSEKGVVRLAARGRQVRRAIDLVGDLTVGQPNIKVRRCDGLHTFEDGTVVEEVGYVVSNPVRQLQVKLGSARRA